MTNAERIAQLERAIVALEARLIAVEARAQAVHVWPVQSTTAAPTMATCPYCHMPVANCRGHNICQVP